MSPYRKYQRAAHARWVEVDIGRAVEIVSDQAIDEYGAEAGRLPPPRFRSGLVRLFAADRRPAALRPGQHNATTERVATGIPDLDLMLEANF